MSFVFTHHQEIGSPASLWRLDQINLQADDHPDQIGYLKVSYVPSARVIAWKDIYRFLADRGSSIGIYGLREPDTATQAEWARLAYRVQEKIESWTAANASHWSDRSITQIRAALEKYRPALERAIGPDRDRFCLFHVDKPMVDYVEVVEAWRGKGVGQILYQEGARWIAERGMVLHASGIQTPAAARAWDRMEKTIEGVDMEEVKGTHPPRRRLRAR